MDINEPSDMNFSNLRNIVNNNVSCPPGQVPAPMDDNQRYLENYKVFSDLNSKGVNLNDLLSRIDTLEQQVKQMDRPKGVDQELFSVMVAATKDCDAVMEAKSRLSDIEHVIIAEMCARDPRFTTAYDDYRKVVYAEYAKMVKNSRVGGRTGPETLEQMDREDYTDSTVPDQTQSI